LTFLPEGYQVPDATTGYMKFKQGENRFRILSSAIVGWEAWNDEDGKRKPIRWANGENYDISKLDEPDKVKHFWAFVVWNYSDKKIQILEITQKGIMKSLKVLLDDEDWGDPKNYDVVVIKEGEDLATTYSVQPKPAKKLDEEVANAWKEIKDTLKLEALFEGKDPFEKVSSGWTEKDNEAVDNFDPKDKDIPF
jgi:hypothetical protein